MFQKWIEKAIVEGKEKEIEIRKDIIWERRCRIIGRVGLELVTKENFDEIIQRPCIFCTPEKLAKFDDEFEKEMLENSHAFLFPNINPYAKYSSVCAFKKHYIKIGEFDSELIEKNLELCIEYINKITKINNEVKYASINWNYMMPAGASILHPHTQVIVDGHPTTYIEKIVEKRELFKEYIKKEINSERFIEEIEGIKLFTPFAPFGFNEIVGVADSSLSSIGSISLALEKILSFYDSIGRNSFNVCIFISLTNDFPLHFRCITRQNMAKYYRNDAMFFERLHFETILEKKPEEVAKEMKQYLRKLL